jgi:CO dehydrogenase/acetyl-CoA synthase alpha subunit
MLRRKESEVPVTMKDMIVEALEQNAKEAVHRRPEKVGRGPMMLRPDRPGTMEQHLFWRK